MFLFVFMSGTSSLTNKSFCCPKLYPQDDGFESRDGAYCVLKTAGHPAKIDKPPNPQQANQLIVYFG